MPEHRLAVFYAEDHHRLDALFLAFQNLKQKDPTRSREALRKFRSGLEQHMAWEEAILLPEYEARIHHPEESCAKRLLAEHAGILNLLDRIDEKLEEPASDTALLEAQFAKALAAHNLTEESGLYLELDKRLDDRERDEIFTKMKQAAWEPGSM